MIYKAPPGTTIALAAATGLTGSQVRTLFQQYYGSRNDNTKPRLRLILRRDIPLLPGEEKVIVPDWSDADAMENAVKNCSDIICAVGTTMAAAGSEQAFLASDHDAVINLAQAARHSGCRGFHYVSSLGAANGNSFYLRTKRKVEQSLMKMGFESLTLLRPSLLKGGRTQFRPGEKMALAFAALLQPLLIGPLRRYRAIPAHHVALVLLMAALQPGIARPVLVMESEEIMAMAQKSME
jgi:uncharacterized protein YbjT (DUF2867 family)